MTNPFTVLIVAPPGRFSDGLQAVVQSLPVVERAIRAQAEETTELLPSDYTPPIIILDATDTLSYHEAQKILMDIRVQYPQSNTIALVNTAAEMQAYASLTDVVLLKGFTTAVLHNAIIDLIRQPAALMPAG